MWINMNCKIITSSKVNIQHLQRIDNIYLRICSRFNWVLCCLYQRWDVYIIYSPIFVNDVSWAFGNHSIVDFRQIAIHYNTVLRTHSNRKGNYSQVWLLNAISYPCPPIYQSSWGQNRLSACRPQMDPMLCHEPCYQGADFNSSSKSGHGSVCLFIHGVKYLVG